MSILPETGLMKIKKISSNKNDASFVIEPLLPGYGMTIANSLRRVLLSSLSGSAITSVKINGVTHEFSTLTGVKEDIVEIILNLKALRVKSYSDEPVVLKLVKKGPGKATAKDFIKNSSVDIIDENFHIATLDKKGKLEMEIVVERGRGYVPTEKRDSKLPLGAIAVDSIFTPIKKIHYQVENTRVGGMTNYEKIIFNISTDGTISPELALKTATDILIDHLGLLSSLISPVPAKKIKVKENKKIVKVSKLARDKKPIKTKKITIKAKAKAKK